MTPTGRVALMEERLSAMLKALDAVQSVLVKFYDFARVTSKRRVSTGLVLAQCETMLTGGAASRQLTNPIGI